MLHTIALGLLCGFAVEYCLHHLYMYKTILLLKLHFTILSVLHVCNLCIIMCSLWPPCIADGMRSLYFRHVVSIFLFFLAYSQRSQITIRLHMMSVRI